MLLLSLINWDFSNIYFQIWPISRATLFTSRPIVISWQLQIEIVVSSFIRFHWPNRNQMFRLVCCSCGVYFWTANEVTPAKAHAHRNKSRTIAQPLDHPSPALTLRRPPLSRLNPAHRLQLLSVPEVKRSQQEQLLTINNWEVPTVREGFPRGKSSCISTWGGFVPP